jgi:glycosyltransferase involved in cell wall biosynthesis
MRVLQFVSTNGHHGLLIDLAKDMKRSGAGIVLGCLEGPGLLHEMAKHLGVESIALGCRSRRDYPRAIAKLALLLGTMRIDVVHTHLVEPTIVGLVAARLAGVPGRVMTRHHSDERLIYKSRKWVVIDRLVERYLAKHTVAISNAVERALKEIDGIPSSRIRRVPNGYDWSRIRSSPEAAQAIRRELGLDERHFLFCHVGRFSWVPAESSWMKGQDRVINAMASGQLPDTARVVFVGPGDSTAAKRLAQQRGVSDQCRFIGHRNDCFDVMAASDVLVHPSLHEAQCQVLIEALALGKAVIASDVGAAEDIVFPEKTGWLIRPRDDDALLAAMREAAADRNRLAAYGEAGQRLVRELYPIERMSRGYEAIYAEQVGRG